MVSFSVSVRERSSWLRALSLVERLALVREAEQSPATNILDAALAEQRLREWRTEPPLSDEIFAQRLAASEMSERDLLRLLGEPAEALHEPMESEPTWLTRLMEAYAVNDGRRERVKPTRNQASSAFLELVRPIIERARDQVRAEAQELSWRYAKVPFDPGFVDNILLANLPENLVSMIGRTLVLELHVAGLRGQLHGETPQERFASFVERLLDPDQVQAHWQEYPVLARAVAARIGDWSSAGQAFLSHLSADWTALRRVFSPNQDPGDLVAITSSGDHHRRGRTVLICTFASGLRLVYKPRSLGVDAHFQDLLSWLNHRGDHPPFKTLTVLDRGDHGWMEHVQPASCRSTDEVRRFYRRQGAYLALLYAIEATDFHYENLIAANEQPLLLDLEGLYHPRLEEAEHVAIKALQFSVLRPGLLPLRYFAGDGEEGFDVSGLGAAADQRTPYAVPQWSGAGTDQMRLTRERVTLPGSNNRPKLNDRPVSAFDYVEDVEAGFTSMYRLLEEQRDELLAADGPLAAFANDEVRVILRSTRTYARLLAESFHPDVLRDALDRDRHFDWLWPAVEHRPYLAQVVVDEQTDLRQGDIPSFTTRPGSRDLWTSRSQPIADFFAMPSLNRVRDRLHRLGHSDWERQVWLIRASLATLSEEQGPAEWVPYRSSAPQAAPTPQRFLEAACAVGDRLAVLALQGDGEVAWLGLNPVRERSYDLAPLAFDLYDGLPGVTLFLAYLGEMTGDDHYTDLARTATSTWRRQLAVHVSEMTSVGGFAGWGGIIYTLSQLAAIWRDPELLREAQAAVERLPVLISQDPHLDVIGGVAGCAAGLLALHRQAPSSTTLAAARLCGERLLATIQGQEVGAAWPTPLSQAKPLTGFSHGAAGISWVLLRLAGATGDARFREVALAGIAYERALYSPSAGNWPDLRELAWQREHLPAGQTIYQTAWCHGAPGIALARIASLSLVDEADRSRLREEIDAGLENVVQHGFGGNHGLCHGDLGNVEALLSASEILEEPRWRAELERWSGSIVERIEQDGWRCATPLGIESPGLMTGLAGVGYGLLRLAAPGRIPSVLLLEPHGRWSDALRQARGCPNWRQS